MKSFDVVVFLEAVAYGRIEWRKHVLQKLAERNIPHHAIREVLLQGELIREYVYDKPFAFALFLGYASGARRCTSWQLVTKQAASFVITVYEPSLEIIEADYRTKRK
ncbi:MAG: DUF4258 domain-containing protein [Verrucomicrobia bacterium]|nr:DUF4258 domain-containing protein [Verrucomicrobiota bacterium]